ncbi:hypothetical protein HPSD74_0578 [Glaesserella parasuis D74]|nr:hypothetical protein HPSD74_0578 [Glaesserella parasuis D74]
MPTTRRVSEANNVPKAEGGIIDIQLLFYPPLRASPSSPRKRGERRERSYEFANFRPNSTACRFLFQGDIRPFVVNEL